MKHRIVKKLMAGVLAGALSLTLLLTPGVQIFAEEQTENLTEEDILSGEGRIPDESIGSEEKIADPVEQDETLPETAEDEIDTGKAEEENKDQEEPVVQDGWVYTEAGWYLYKDGVMLTGWQWVGGNCYYMYENGIMAEDTWIDSYYVNASGAWVPSYQPPHWVLSSAGWWYRNADGSYPANAWQLIDDQWYYFNGAGYMMTGWQPIGGTWYYLSGSGAMLTGWQLIGGAWYYLNETSGAMATGWLLLGDTWYYLNSSGAMATGWLLLGNTWYYLDGSGAMLTGKQEIGKQVYFLKDNGAMVIGWNQEEDVWYYYSASGAMATGWVLDGSKWYYCEPKTGAMQTGWLDINKVRYYLDESGAMQTGWYQVDGKWYYGDSNGAMLKSRWVGNYYVQADGSMAVSQYIGDYYVGADGKWVETTGNDRVYEVGLADGEKTIVIGQYDEAASKEVFTLLNKYRVENGLNPLQPAGPNLQAAVNIRGYELAYSFDHTRPNGESCFSVYENAMAENIAGGTGLTAEGAMTLWKNSEGHKLNMLNSVADSVGVAAFKANVNGVSTTYYVQLFAVEN